ncbi:hypothetical protein DFH06DRAFT_1466145 [Mycena polygramma]|nr:hypothetical protein DFH06DRAFT_1466145 [Mycena polygramma]
MSVSLEVARDIRVASLAVAIYEYIITLPAEYRFYTRQENKWRPRASCVLFFLIRYSSVAVIVSGNVGFFATFTPQACRAFYLATPLFKVLQGIVCQAVLGVRSYAISKCATWVKYVLSIAFVVSSAVEIWSNTYARIPAQTNGHCSSTNSPGHPIAWVYHLASMIFDVFTVSISLFYLIIRTPGGMRLSGLWKCLMIDGISFFLVLTAVNLLNLILYNTATPTAQAAAVPLGYSIVFIMTQRILINLQNFSQKAAHGPSGSSQSRNPVSTPARLRAWEFGMHPNQSAAAAHADIPDGQLELSVRVHVTKTSDMPDDPTHSDSMCERVDHKSEYV